MAIEEIISAIDEYIGRLRAARDLITSPRKQPEISKRTPLKRKNRRTRDSIGPPVTSPGTTEVAIQIIPARLPREQRRRINPAVAKVSALGGPIPKGPVVIPPSDLARIRSLSTQVQSPLKGPQPTGTGGALEELAREVAKRLGSGGGFFN
jgi:hypothetical protein